MQRDSLWGRQGKVVHVVGRLSSEVIGFLGPATHALAHEGFEQQVVMIDALQHRQHVAQLHESAELLLVSARRNPMAQWKAVLRAFRSVLNAGAVQAVHLHGVGPGLIAGCVARAAGRQASIFHSPHGARSFGLLGAVAAALVRPLLRTPRDKVVNKGPGRAQASATDRVELPIEDAFFAVSRHEARHPLIVTGGRAAEALRGVERVAQLAVLLGGDVPRIGFNWIGRVDDVSRARLGAAGVGVFDAAAGAETAARFAPGWIYLAPVPSPGFPRSLVEAMAAGLPCIAFDCAQHRLVVRAGETGYLCVSERDMIERIATLIDEPALRVRLGAAAREAALSQFGEAAFVRRLRLAYALST